MLESHDFCECALLQDMLAESWLPAAAEEEPSDGEAKPAPAFNPAAPEYTVRAWLRLVPLIGLMKHGRELQGGTLLHLPQKSSAAPGA